MILFSFLILLTINYCFIYFFGKFNYTLLNCGITGFVPKKGHKINLDKLFFLAIANEERGTDSCGISVGNHYCTYGIKELSKARDFILTIKEELANEKLLNAPVIFHTRKSTNGAHNTRNAHPMQYFWKVGEKEKYLTLAHNGTVTDTWDLFNKYVKPYSTKAKYVDYIDTRIFAHGFAAAFHAQDFTRLLEMLKVYKGAAAFLFYTNTHFFVWKGAAGDTVERPMYYVETKEGWYFHSISSVLEIAFNTKPVEVPNNTLITFNQSGPIDSVVIPRTKVTTTTYYGNHNSYYKPPVSTAPTKPITTGIVKLNEYGLFTQNNTVIDGYFSSMGNFCRGYSVYYSNNNVYNTVNKLAKIHTKEDFMKFVDDNGLSGFIGIIPIIDKSNKLVAVYEVAKNGFVEDGASFFDNRTLKKYTFKNNKIVEYVTESSNN